MSATPVLLRPHLDADGDRITIEHAQDVEDIVERNKGLQSLPQRSDWGRHIATIPNVILVRWMNEEHARGNMVMPFTAAFDQVVARKLRDPDWAFLRTDSQAVQGWMGFGSSAYAPPSRRSRGEGGCRSYGSTSRAETNEVSEGGS